MKREKNRQADQIQWEEAKKSKEQLLAEKREVRKKRRRRSQVAAYTVVIALIALVAVGIVSGVRQLTEYSRENTESSQEPSDVQDQQSMVGDLFGMEESLQEPDTSQAEPPVVELTDEQKLDEIVNAGIEVMPLEDKVAGLFFVTPEAITGVSAAVQAGDGTRQALSQYAVGGLVYFSQNMKSKDQLAEMIDNTRLYANYPLFIAVDEEGGSVSRVAGAGFADKQDSAQAVAATGDPNNAYQAGAAIGAYLAELGFNLDFAPVADLANVEGSSMEARSYGDTAQSVIPYVTSMVTGLQEQGVTACLKHFPGIGSSTADTHNGMATTDRTQEEFRAEEFTVFQAGIDAGAKMVMVGHMAAPELTGDNTPCSLSDVVVTDILRDELKFDGVVISDALNMSAITDYYTADQAAVLALRAGCDMILMPEDFEMAYNGVIQAVQDGTISEERINDSLRRIYRIKYADRIGE
ncbi:MAG: hypothetical protein NC417_01480 [Candidatus Gastranaerophilales bacterium]|nr:hypothetical protein [Candidatus Gastranaerophilales bacterium]